MVLAPFSYGLGTYAEHWLGWSPSDKRDFVKSRFPEEKFEHSAEVDQNRRVWVQRDRNSLTLLASLLTQEALLLLFSCLVMSDPLRPHDCSTPAFPVLHHLPELAQNHVHRVGDAIQPSHPLSALLLLPLVFPSIRVFCNEPALLIRWPNYWRFSISPSNEYSGWFSFRMDWLDLLAIQGTLKSLTQHRNSKASILQHSLSLWCSSYIHTWLLEKS